MLINGLRARQIAIVGAGIGGLTFAAAMARREISTYVYDRRSSLSGDGFGLNIQPDAIGELYTLGLEEALSSVAIRTRAHRYVDSNGVTLFEEPRGLDAGHSWPQYSILRADLLKLLQQVAEPFASFRLGVTITTETLQSTGICAPPVGGVVPSDQLLDLIIGADGIHSVVRNVFFPETMSLNRGGMIMWRGITQMPRLLDGRTMIIGNEPKGVRLIAYPVSKPLDTQGFSLVNWVCMTPQTEGSLHPDHADGRVEVLKALIGWNFDWLDLQGMVLGSETIMRAEMVDRDPIPTWSHGRTVLLGDAAHAMYPVGANGATQAILDAIFLADSLETCGDVREAIKRYEAVRIPLTSGVVLANRKMNRRELSSSHLRGRDRLHDLQETTTEYCRATRTSYS